jgi:DMSO/TMAO reductase YedYZ heme-binding membrane subunit
MTFNPRLWWYVARASGFVAWVLVVASLLWGLAVSGRFTRRHPSPAWVLDVHRFLGGLAVSFTGIHLVALVFDSYVYFGWSELLVPFASDWNPGPVAWGIVGFYLLLAIELTSLAMRWLPRSLWRWVHRSSYALAVVVTIHGVFAGTDARSPAVRIGIAVGLGLFTTALIIRLWLPSLRREERRARLPDTSTV